MPKAKRPQRQPLTRRRILEAAVTFADAHGLEALTMRKVADELGAGVMSLYNHVADKDEMIVGMVDLAVGEIDAPSVASGWKTALRASAAAAHEVLLRHHWAPAEWSRRLPGPERIRYMESILAHLSAGGLKPALVYSGYHAVTMHIVGYTLQEIGYRQVLDADFEATAGSFLESVASEYPHMAEHVRAHLDGHDEEDEFGFVLDLILDGLERASAVVILPG